MKTCSSCRAEKTTDQFHMRRASPDGLALVCRQCSSERGRQHYLQEKDAAKKRATEWAKANRDRRLEISKKSDRKHQEARRVASREYNKQKRAADPESAREAGRRHAAIRRSREQGAGGSVSASSWATILAVFETNVCIYCGATDRKLTMDHWVPVKLGGPTEVGNLIPCCKSCNSSKNDKAPEEWIASLPERGGGVSIPEFLAITREAENEFHAVYGREVTLT